MQRERETEQVPDMTERPQEPFRISGYYPGVVGEITRLHATYYAAHWGFDHSFETQVGRELSEFVAAYNPAQDGLWAAAGAHRLAGAVAIDGSTWAAEGARLRWFIVDPEHQGRGLGRVLLGEALSFCREARFPRVFLWTFRGLDAARSLYERAGFQLREEHRVAQWGGAIDEQLFVLDLPAPPSP